MERGKNSSASRSVKEEDASSHLRSQTQLLPAGEGIEGGGGGGGWGVTANGWLAGVPDLPPPSRSLFVGPPPSLHVPGLLPARYAPHLFDVSAQGWVGP